MEEPKITSVEKPKNPKRVEAGKRLGAISRQAKEKKAKELALEREQTVANKSSYADVPRILELSWAHQRH